MHEYTLIYLEDNRLLLTDEPFGGWREVQERYPGYRTSLEFGSLDEVRDFLMQEYGLTKEVADRLTENLSRAPFGAVELKF